MLIDDRSFSSLEDVGSDYETNIGTSTTTFNGDVAGHRAVVAKIRCRLKAKPGNLADAGYIRADCLKKDIQEKIHRSLLRKEKKINER